jgi:hypothetical protein
MPDPRSSRRRDARGKAKNLIADYAVLSPPTTTNKTIGTEAVESLMAPPAIITSSIPRSTSQSATARSSAGPVQLAPLRSTASTTRLMNQ